jgi:hypothetical protein
MSKLFKDTAKISYEICPISNKRANILLARFVPTIIIYSIDYKLLLLNLLYRLYFHDIMNSLSGNVT